MKILSHRGKWELKNDQNTMKSFISSFKEGMGIETDIRDFMGEIVISHDVPTSRSLLLEDVLINYNLFKDETIFLALNVKSDGLYSHVNELLRKHDIINYFVFDMSIPDTLGYMNEKLKFFVRQSEFELEPNLYNQANGIWLDSFHSEWYDIQLIQNHLDQNKFVAIVSPELHKREYMDFWKKLKSINLEKSNNIFLCTDFPNEANLFFNSIN